MVQVGVMERVRASGFEVERLDDLALAVGVPDPGGFLVHLLSAPGNSHITLVTRIKIGRTLFHGLLLEPEKHRRGLIAALAEILISFDGFFEIEGVRDLRLRGVVLGVVRSVPNDGDLRRAIDQVGRARRGCQECIDRWTPQRVRKQLGRQAGTLRIEEFGR